MKISNKDLIELNNSLSILAGVTTCIWFAIIENLAIIEPYVIKLDEDTENGKTIDNIENEIDFHQFELTESFINEKHVANIVLPILKYLVK